MKIFLYKTKKNIFTHRAHVASPDPVKTWLSDPGNRQQDMYEVCVPTVFFREDKSSSMVRGYTVTYKLKNMIKI